MALCEGLDVSSTCVRVLACLFFCPCLRHAWMERLVGESGSYVADVSSMPFCVTKEMDVDAASVAPFLGFSVWLSHAGV